MIRPIVAVLLVTATIASIESQAVAHDILINTGSGLLRNCEYESDDQAEVEYHFGLCVGFIKGVGNAWAIDNELDWCPDGAIDNGRLVKAVVTRLKMLPAPLREGPSAPLILSAMKNAFPCSNQ